MGIFSKTEVPVGTLFFAEKMSNIKKAFKEAHENANTLHGEMEQQIQLKLSKIKEASETYYDKKEGYMYLKYPNVTQLW